MEKIYFLHKWSSSDLEKIFYDTYWKSLESLINEVKVLEDFFKQRQVLKTSTKNSIFVLFKTEIEQLRLKSVNVLKTKNDAVISKEVQALKIDTISSNILSNDLNQNYKSALTLQKPTLSTKSIQKKEIPKAKKQVTLSSKNGNVLASEARKNILLAKSERAKKIREERTLRVEKNLKLQQIQRNQRALARAQKKQEQELKRQLMWRKSFKESNIVSKTNLPIATSPNKTYLVKKASSPTSTPLMKNNVDSFTVQDTPINNIAIPQTNTKMNFSNEDVEEEIIYETPINIIQIKNTHILRNITLLNDENYFLDDLSSNDETDDEDNPRKEVPKWAKEKICEIHNYLHEDQIDRFFGQMKEPKIEEIFWDYISKKTMPYRDPSLEWESPFMNNRHGNEVSKNNK